MEMTILLVIQVLLSCAIIGLILIQQGKGATTGAAFGSGASSTVFGARGSASFLTRTTAILAILFFANSFMLSYLYSHATAPKSLMERATSMSESAPPAPEKTKAKTGESAGSDLPPAGSEKTAAAGAAAPAQQPPAGQSSSDAGKETTSGDDMPPGPSDQTAAKPGPAGDESAGGSAPKN